MVPGKLYICRQNYCFCESIFVCEGDFYLKDTIKTLGADDIIMVIEVLSSMRSNRESSVLLKVLDKDGTIGYIRHFPCDDSK